MDLADRLEKHIHQKGITDEELFKILNLSLFYLGAKTVAQYAEQEGISVQAVYKLRPVKTILGRKVVFDNL